ncbi:hypothetical protein EYF80_066288 [Liparis tanakae]|uniref:Uncharacterized protein n=1 Tax=Liparis tanakae TaxID=230148 RepID=A0A4Z2E4T8_9TELE|nr:hypothetical protein EYF80_066288 [Liparis tanakae]
MASTTQKSFSVNCQTHMYMTTTRCLESGDTYKQSSTRYFLFSRGPFKNIVNAYISARPHHEEQLVEQPPGGRGLPLGSPGQRAALPAQPVSSGRGHDGSTD